MSGGHAESHGGGHDTADGGHGKKSRGINTAFEAPEMVGGLVASICDGSFFGFGGHDKH